jgi:hypothetical protein
MSKPVPAAQREPSRRRRPGSPTARDATRGVRQTRQIAALAGRLTDRDRHLCRLLHEHRVFTTHQLIDLAFPSQYAAETRLRTLTELEVLDRFRPRLATGSAPYHYVLGPLGAQVLAAERGVTVRQLGYRHPDALAVAHHQRLGHLIGVNGFFAALAGHARRHPGAELIEWWSERRATATWGDVTRPDGYGRWTELGRTVDFFLEYDNDTEPAHRVAAKLPGYRLLADATGVQTPILFSFPAPARETGVRTALIARADAGALPIATTYREDDPGPMDKVWLPLQHSTRRSMSELADAAVWGALVSTWEPA